VKWAHLCFLLKFLRVSHTKFTKIGGRFSQFFEEKNKKATKLGVFGTCLYYYKKTNDILPKVIRIKSHEKNFCLLFYLSPTKPWPALVALLLNVAGF